MMTVRLLYVFLLIVPLIACGPAPREGIVGTWVAGSQVVEIKEDGNIIFTDQLKEQPSTGSYRFMDDKRIKVTFADSSSEEFKLSVSASKLTVTRADGTIFAKYSRVR